MQVHIVSLFPESLHPYLQTSIMKKAQEKGLFGYKVYNLAKWSTKNTRRVDDRPYWWGSGTIITIEPLTNCIRSIIQEFGEMPIFVMSPKWEIFSQEIAENFSKLESFLIICGHYEGIDARIFSIFPEAREISLGKYVLSSGEIAGLVCIDAAVRLVDGVISEKSLLEESYSPTLDRKKEYPQYSRPHDFEGHCVPEVLISGNFSKINEWKKNHLQP